MVSVHIVLLLSCVVPLAVATNDTDFNASSVGPGPWQNLRWSYALNSDMPLLVSKQTSLFDLKESDVLVGSTPTSHVEFVTHSSEADFASDLGVSTSAHYSSMGFSGAASAKFNRVHKINKKTFKTSRLGKSTKYTVAIKEHDLYKKLTTSSRDKLVSAHPEDIRSTFGDFYATQGIYGGVFSASYVTDASKESTESSVKADIKANFLAGGVKFDTSSVLKKDKFGLDTFFSMSAYGGDAKILLKMKNAQDSLKIQYEWAESLRDDNLFPTKLTLEPIWKLLEGRYDSKAAEIKKYVTDKWQKEGNKVPHPTDTTTRNCDKDHEHKWCNQFGGRRRRGQPTPSGWALKVLEKRQVPGHPKEWVSPGECPDGCRWGGEWKLYRWCDDNGGYWFCDIYNWVPGMAAGMNGTVV